jgi:hypothetical protein
VLKRRRVCIIFNPIKRIKMLQTNRPLKPFTPCIVITILLIAITQNSFCQKDWGDYDYIDNKIYISLSPCALIDVLDYPSIRISADAKVYKNISISVENAIYPTMGLRFYKEDVSGFAIKPCVKFYLKRNQIINKNYIGLEYQYKQQYYHLTDSIKLNSGNPFYKRYGVTRYINCINVKYGELYNLNKRWIAEWFAGIGIRFFHSFTDLPQEEYDGIIFKEALGNTSMAGSQARQTGNRTILNFTAGVNIGYRLW